ncbi:MAG: M15 family metallopeptidase [Ignavibacteriaceae bacterium]
MSKNFIKFLVPFFVPALFLAGAKRIKVYQPSLFALKKICVNDTVKIISDSNCSLSEALSGKNIPSSIRKLLTIVPVYYYSFDGRLHKGQIVINKNLAEDIKEIFKKIKERKFPIDKVIPIYKYNWDDKTSMKDDNTSAFNYRTVKGTKILSKHASGRAIDINPKLNPQIKNRLTIPKNSFYNKRLPGTVSDTSFIVRAFLAKGWRWGGHWKHLKDYQHFEK